MRKVNRFWGSKGTPAITQYEPANLYLELSFAEIAATDGIQRCCPNLLFRLMNWVMDCNLNLLAAQNVKVPAISRVIVLPTCDLR